jgi:hypothetical protein
MSWTAVFTELEAGLPAGTLLHGPDDINMQSSPPRVTWEPVSAVHVPPQTIGGGAGDDGDIWLRELTCSMTVWGATIEATDTLFELVVQIIHDACTQFSYRISGEKWNTGGKLANGCVVEFSLVLKVPLRRTVKGVATITEIRQRAHLTGSTEYVKDPHYDDGD